MGTGILLMTTENAYIGIELIQADEELQLISCLNQVTRHFEEQLNDKELARVAAWYESRYTND